MNRRVVGIRRFVEFIVRFVASLEDEIPAQAELGPGFLRRFLHSKSSPELGIAENISSQLA
jgi:hypothetical protein